MTGGSQDDLCAVAHIQARNNSNRRRLPAVAIEKSVWLNWAPRLQRIRSCGDQFQLAKARMNGRTRLSASSRSCGVRCGRPSESQWKMADPDRRRRSGRQPRWRQPGIEFRRL